MYHQKTAHEQHSSHNFLCAPVKFLGLSGPPLLGLPQGKASLNLWFPPLCFRVHRGGQGGPCKGLWPPPPITHQPKAASCYLFYISRVQMNFPLKNSWFMNFETTAAIVAGVPLALKACDPKCSLLGTNRLGSLQQKQVLAEGFHPPGNFL